MENNRWYSGRGRRARRALLVFLLLACLAGAGYLGFLAAMELKETKQGGDFYARLAVFAESTPISAQNAAAVDGSLPPEATAQPEDAAVSRPSEVDFDALRQTCPDVVGWIRIEDSVIDYPIVRGADNDYYLSHLADGTPNRAGCIMMDASNHGDFSDDVTILHGHHMRNGSMFGQLENYREEAYYRAHKNIRLYTPAGDYEAVVFAACTVNGYTFGYPTSFRDEAEFETFLRRVQSAASYETDVNVEYGDRILLLSTCAYSYDGARFIVLGKIIADGEAAQ